MEASDHDDRKRRWVKPRKRRSWAKALLRPQTWKTMAVAGIAITRVIWIIYKAVHFMRE
jgi:hypothetical protein